MPLTLNGFPTGAGSITIALKTACFVPHVLEPSGKLSLASGNIKDSPFVCGGFSNWKDATVVFESSSGRCSKLGFHSFIICAAYIFIRNLHLIEAHKYHTSHQCYK